ncbi:VOC family protein [Alteriqipengyuania sp.]|uniref:VOC family protein n=1 Tax=Alteriqipengyuania sp. TaxID=2800692 RepID=UPI003512918D
MSSEALLRSIAVVTLGSDDIARSVAFYSDGFGWEPEFRNESVAFYQMNGFVFGVFASDEFEDDMARKRGGSSLFALAHNVANKAEVDAVMARLIASGASPLREADEPPHGGYRGYVADPDGHAWEIAWNPFWPIDADGHVELKVPGDSA